MALADANLRLNPHSSAIPCDLANLSSLRIFPTAPSEQWHPRAQLQALSESKTSQIVKDLLFAADIHSKTV
jgi:hypothetical protein